MSAIGDCVFCRIVSGDAPAHRIHEDDRLLVFMDLFPAAPGHTLIIPRRHRENIFEIERDELLAVTAFSHRLAPALRSVFAPDGIAVFQLNGAAAGQSVFHYHTHLVPCRDGEALQFHGRQAAPAEVLAGQARDIAAALARIA